MGQKRIEQTNRRKANGQSLIEVMTGFIIFIPLAFLAVDIVGVTTVSQTNEQFAEGLARVCASQQNQTAALRAAQVEAQNFPTNSTIIEVDVDQVSYDLGLGQVTVSTVMQFKLPIPLPGYSVIPLRASAIQPIVAIPAPP
jgi:Flp pilus assembly protein TadG